MPTSAASAGTSVKQKDIARYGDLYDFSNLVDRLRFSTPPRLSRYYIVISHTPRVWHGSIGSVGGINVFQVPSARNRIALQPIRATKVT